jgi:hypothetical protein
MLPAGRLVCRCGKRSATAPAEPTAPPLTRRRPAAPVPLCEAAAARAAMTACATRLQVPVRAWHGHHDGTATAVLADGTHLHYRDGGPAKFTAIFLCPRGADHVRQINGPASLDQARSEVAACTEQHAGVAGRATAAVSRVVLLSQMAAR